MSDMPDFDSMSPEEMMKWMESLAKRQGAAEGFTTEANLEIDEVDENDERLAGMGEYKPYGMSDEDWAKMQEREAAEKAERLAAMQEQPAATPPPQPEPVVETEPEPEPEPAQPVAADAGADGTPDFDNMSPEEMMEWMESLAKRQGAAEGFTTSASMQVEEVDENDERLAGMGEYKPYGMSDEDWAKMQEREASEKAARLAAQSQDEVPVAAEPEYTYEDDEDYDDYDDDEEFFESAEDSEELIMAVLEADDEGETEPALPNFEDIMPAESVAEAESPMDWLAGLSAGDDDGTPDLGLDGLDNLDEGLGALASLGDSQADAGDDPMAWLAGLSADDGDSGAPDLSAIMSGDNVIGDDGDDSEGSLEWMESLAAEEGADSEELYTDASMDIAAPDNVLDDGPGYEDFSFEEATGVVSDADSDIPVASTGDSDMVLEDPEGWLDSLASGVSSNELPEDLFSGGIDNEIPDDLFDDEAFAASAADEDGDSDEFEGHAAKVKDQIESGRLGDSPEDVDKFFQSAFAKAATRDDVPDYLDDEDSEDVAEDEDEAMPVAAEIPDWLQESMSTMPSDDDDDILAETPVKKATAEMMIADLGLDDDIEEAEIPDWLAGGVSEDSGIIEDNIFSDEIIEDGELSIGETGDTQDTWVAAFSNEDSPELEEWYSSAVAGLEGDDTAAAPAAETATAGDVTLAQANLPVESKLAEGSPQNVPGWLGDTSDQSVEVEAVQSDMSWLGEEFDGEDEDAIPAFVLDDGDDADIPDWLQETVDDSVTADEDLPDWLAGETDISTDEIPDWLRETMDDDEEPVIVDEAMEDVFAEADTAPDPEPAAAPLPATVQQSPAPVPVSASKVNPVEYLRSAKTKIEAGDIDGAMIDYEQIIRANKALSQVEKELSRLAEEKEYAKNPSINRVLGDVLMRQGKLQEALDTYRKALNML